MALLPKKTFRTGKRRRRRTRRQIITTGLAACGVGMLMAFVGYLARLDEVTIRDVSVEGGETVSHAVIKERIFTVLSGNYALIIPRRFSYLYPREEIIAEIARIPRVDRVYVERLSRNEIKVSFTEYTPHALWCDTVAVTASSTPECLFVDTDGRAFADAPLLRGGALLRYANETREPKTGEYVFEDNMISVVEEFSRALERRHQLRIRAVVASKDGDFVFHLREGGTILISRDANLQEMFDNLASILGSAEFEDLNPEDIEYIDLRFGEKVYLKEKEPYVPQSEGASSTEAGDSIE